MSEPYAAAGAPWGREAGDLGPAKAASPALFFISVPSRDLWNLLTVFVTVYRTPSPRGRRVTHTRRAALSGSAGVARASSHALSGLSQKFLDYADACGILSSVRRSGVCQRSAEQYD